MTEPLLRVEDLTVTVPTRRGPRAILDHVTFDLYPHEVLGLVGESGSGKTMTALAVMGLLPPAARVSQGRVWFDGRDLLGLAERERAHFRGSQIAMIFQNPRAALSPLMRVGDQVSRALRIQRKLGSKAAYDAALDLLRRVGIPDANARARAYPHQLSGGMAQRVLIAMMLACQPRLLIADEPTTGLDVTIQAQIFELIKDIQAETGAALLLITHDLGVVSEVCQRVVVMYAGQVMEVAAVPDLFAHAHHPYTEQLLGSILRVDRPGDLNTTRGLLPVAIAYETMGCRFANQCAYVRPVCHQRRPSSAALAPQHDVLCHQYSDDQS